MRYPGDFKDFDYSPRTSKAGIAIFFINCCDQLDHITSIIRMIVKIFLTVRLHHVAKERNIDNTKKLVRHKNTKSIHQKNQ